MWSVIKSVLCSILCMICDCCDGHEDCPDGVCDELRAVTEEFRNGSPEPSATLPQSVQIDWTRIQPTIDALVTAVKELMLLFGVKSKLG